MTNSWARFGSKGQFFAYIDENDNETVPAGNGTVPTGEDAFEPVNLDGPLESDHKPDRDRPSEPPAAATPWADCEQDRGDFSEPPEPAPEHAFTSSSTVQPDNNPDAVYPGERDDDDPNYDRDYGPIDANGHPTAGFTPFGNEHSPNDNADKTTSAATRFNKPVVIGFLSAVGVVAIGVAAAMVGMQSGSTEPASSAADPSSVVSVVPAPPAPPAAAPINDPSQDVPIPFQASSPCPQAGSGSAQNVASDDPTKAWVCMRDSDGQVMTLDLGKPMKVTAIELTPGWVGTDASGADQWMAHRVVTRVQWILINGADRTVVTQDTKNAHGPVTQAMPSNGPDQGVLASQIQMVILQTSRPPSDSPAPGTQGSATEPPTGGGLLDSVLGAPVGGLGANPNEPGQDPNFGTNETRSDPVDNTVAISSITIHGHPPL